LTYHNETRIKFDLLVKQSASSGRVTLATFAVIRQKVKVEQQPALTQQV
jgi:hypothetical protein